MAVHILVGILILLSGRIVQKGLILSIIELLYKSFNNVNKDWRNDENFI
jgi:hypothetical protein